MYIIWSLFVLSLASGQQNDIFSEKAIATGTSEFLQSPQGILKSLKCLPTDQIPSSARSSLSVAESRLLPGICWREDLLPLLRDVGGPSLASRGIPAGVSCNVTTW